MLLVNSINARSLGYSLDKQQDAVLRKLLGMDADRLAAAAARYLLRWDRVTGLADRARAGLG